MLKVSYKFMVKFLFRFFWGWVLFCWVMGGKVNIYFFFSVFRFTFLVILFLFMVFMIRFVWKSFVIDNFSRVGVGWVYTCLVISFVFWSLENSLFRDFKVFGIWYLEIRNVINRGFFIFIFGRENTF